MANALYRKPIPGLVAFTIAFLSQWLGHSAWAFTRGAFGDAHIYAELLMGAVGAALIGFGLKRPEVQGTWMGVLGALLVWTGWFEFTFDFFADLFAIPAWTSPTGLEVFGGGALLMATLPIMLALFTIYGLFNRQTKCNLIRWIHRNIGLTPGMPTGSTGRSHARIAAMETVMVIWFCYLFWLWVGYMFNNTVIMTIYLAWVGWTAYIFIRLLKIPRVGLAVRYGVPVGIVGWGVAEMPAHFGLYSEIWLKPFDYPIVSLVMLAIFVASFIYVATPPEQRQAAAA